MPSPYDRPPVVRINPPPPSPDPKPPPPYTDADFSEDLFFKERPARGYRVRSETVWRAARDAYVAGESAEAVCARHDLGLSAFRQRARREGWRRSDAEDAEPVSPTAYPPEPQAAPPAEALADLAWRSAAQAIRRGRVYEARAWMKLHAELQEAVRREAAARRQAAWEAGAPDPELDAHKARRDAAAAQLRAILDRLPGKTAAATADGDADGDADEDRDEDDLDEDEDDDLDEEELGDDDLDVTALAHDDGLKADAVDAGPDEEPAHDGSRDAADARLHALHPEDAVQSRRRRTSSDRPGKTSVNPLAPPGFRSGPAQPADRQGFVDPSEDRRGPVLSGSEGPGE